MEQFAVSLKGKINKEIQIIESEEENLFHKSTKIIELLENAFDELKDFILNYTFKYQSEEIQFFKEIKPQFAYGSAIFHNNDDLRIKLNDATKVLNINKEHLRR